MQVLAHQLRYADGQFRGTSGVIATAVLEGPSGFALIDPGPTSDLAALEADLASGGLSLDNLEAVLLTHIHLDHAGATGTIVKDGPQPGPPRNGRVLVLFGPPDGLVGWTAGEAARPAEDLLPRVRRLTR